MEGTSGPLLDLDLLRTLVAIVETGGFSAAGVMIGRSPSAVSMQIKRLEEIIGHQVFERDSRNVTLTVEGEHLLVHGRQVLELNNRIIRKFVSQDLTGSVRLGALDYAVEQFLPGLLKQFSRHHPGITVDVTVENSANLLDRMHRRQLDIAIVTCESTSVDIPGIEILRREQLVWAGAKGGVSVKCRPLPISVWEQGCVWRSAALAALHYGSIDYHINFKSAYISGQKAAILADLVVAPLPASSCGGDITILGPEHGLPELRDFALCMAVQPELDATVGALIEKIRSYVPKLTLSSVAD